MDICDMDILKEKEKFVKWEKASQQPCAFNRGIHTCKGKRDAGVAASVGARGASATTCSQIFSARIENL
jgi:hypothetical protein